MRKIHGCFGLVLALSVLSCGGSKINLSPLLNEFTQYEKEAEDLNPATQGGLALETARAKWQSAQPLIERGKAQEALPILEQAIADARVAWEVRQAYEADRRTDLCRQMADRHRFAWEDALTALALAERVAGRPVTDVERETPVDHAAEDRPIPPPVIAGASPVEGNDSELREVWRTWSEAARARGVAFADLTSRFDAAIAHSTDKGTKEMERSQTLYLAGRTIQELEARVRVAVAEQKCATLQEEIERLRAATENVHKAALELQQGYAEELQAKAISREDEMYAALRQLEGKYASIQQSARGTIVSLADILFDFDKATLKRDVEFNLVRVATILNQFPEMKIKVEGHTDNVGTPEYNLDLSKRRAQAVSDFLASMGVGPERMTSEGYGLTRPVADNATEAGRQKNRRVDLVIKEEP